MPSGTSNTNNLLIEVRRVFSVFGEVVDMPALDAIDAVLRFPAQWAYTPFPGKPTDLVRRDAGGRCGERRHRGDYSRARLPRHGACVVRRCGRNRRSCP
jgi:hypothetical protein